MDQGKGAKKRMKQDIHPNYQPVVFMDSSNSFQVQLKDLQKLLNGKMATLIHYYVLRLLQTHTHSTLVVKNSHKPTDVWTVSTKNTVSKTKMQIQTHSLSKHCYDKVYRGFPLWWETSIFVG